MDTQDERGLARHAETLLTASEQAEKARSAMRAGAVILAALTEHTTGARIYGLFAGDRAVMLEQLNDSVHAIEDAENALRLARAAIEQLPA